MIKNEKNLDEIDYFKKRKFKLDKAKDIVAIVCGISMAVMIGSCTSTFKIKDNNLFTYSLGSVVGSGYIMFYFDDEIKKCDEKIKKVTN